MLKNNKKFHIFNPQILSGSGDTIRDVLALSVTIDEQGEINLPAKTGKPASFSALSSYLFSDSDVESAIGIYYSVMYSLRLVGDESEELTSIGKGLNGFVKYYEFQSSGDIEVSDEASEDHTSAAGVNIFNRLVVPEYLESFIVKDRFNSDALLAKKPLESSLTYLFRLLSMDDSEAGTVTDDIIKDLARVTSYNKDDIGKIPDVMAVVTMLDNFNEEIPLAIEE